MLRLMRNGSGTVPGLCCACSTPEAAKERVGFPLSLQKQNAHMLIMKAVRSSSISRRDSEGGVS